MPTQQEQIDYLIKEVNKLRDQGCGCEDCTELPEGFVSPNLEFNWGIASPTQNASDYFRTINVSGDNMGTATMNIYNLEVDISNFSEIQEYNPILLIDRYKYRTKKDTIRYRKSGYKHEPLNINNRINEVALTSEKQIINFNQENYFKYNDRTEQFQGLGMGKRYNSPGRDGRADGIECFIHLGFRMRLTIDGVDYETNHLGYLRMELERVFGRNKIVTLKYRYA